MNNEKDNYQKIKVSKSAYHFLKEKSKLDKYHGRGIIGVVDDLTIGEFTTTGSGSYLKNKQSKKLKKSFKKALTNGSPFGKMELDYR